jgi:hypothetical protein
MAIDPKTWSPEHYETGKKEIYQYHTFALRIPLELDGDDLDFLKLDYLS